MPRSFAPDWSSHRSYSYAAVLALVGLGVAFPTLAGWLLGVPLAVGMVVLGVAHGACDQFVLPASQPVGIPVSGWRYWRQFLIGYLGLAALVGGLWWWWPAATVAGFFLLTVWHWGSADAPANTQVPTTWWLTHSLLRGLLIFAVPAWGRAQETMSLVNELLAFVGAAPVSAATFETIAVVLGVLVIGGHAALWAGYTVQHRTDLLKTELVEVSVLTLLFVALPPRLSVAVYFVFWHSLQHILRLNGWLGYASGAKGKAARSELLAQLVFFLRRAAPLLLLSCVALLVLGRVLAPRLPDATAWFSLALVVAAIVTLPHALLVTAVMDGHRWKSLRLGKRTSAPARTTATARVHS
ncbi:Brp/Blh family beta-carotene 15,15'-dioxygenase [Hymenobacter arizonensis]|uniref:Probable beta-carotene 15,15'-dioxygenase n=1 Tax=Hymenobacter arizonensis TaxID=1227077 RepID=A0A1I5WJ93_HYMAR|nr:Brp/Blh family beta-carotene 15,15'-dioxygenase [Hymenobacter arizonensis]SFQ19711.1 beta-carotene 15,15'-monooxygenase, Brp/Blh family [Hymenobacter arizonensis]